jgi:hypothetical protein
MNPITAAQQVQVALVRILRERLAASGHEDIYAVAYKLGIDWKALLEVEHGLRPASPEEQRRIACYLDAPQDLLFASPKTPAQVRRWFVRLFEQEPTLRKAFGVPSPRPRWPWHGKGSPPYQRRRNLAEWRTRLVRLVRGGRLPHARRPRQPNLVKLVRLVRHISYRKLQEAMTTRISLVKLWRVENDFLRPGPNEAHELARALGVHAEPLFCFKQYANVTSALDYLMQFAPFQRRWVVRMVEALRRQLAAPNQAASGRQSPGAGSG